MRIVPTLLFSILMVIPACGGGSGDGDGGSGDGGNNGRDGGDSEFTDARNPEACKFVDLVFAVDPSMSMNEEMDSMATEVFPDFAQALRGISDGLENYRIGVIDACPLPANFHIGGNTVADCNFESGEVWMDSSSSDLDGEFACVGDIDRNNDCSGDNDDEQPASASAASLEPPVATTGANAGFLRDNALLVVVAITDEDEQPVPGNTAAGVYDRLVAIKGDVAKMVFLGIGGGPGGCSDGAYGSADEAVMLHQITNMFIAADRGVWWDLCDGQLGDGLADAMAVIEQACDDFPPVD